jgi:hypothetical protein
MNGSGEFRVSIVVTNTTNTLIATSPLGVVAMEVSPGLTSALETDARESCWTLKPHETQRLAMTGPLSGATGSRVVRHWTTLIVSSKGDCRA